MMFSNKIDCHAVDDDDCYETIAGQEEIYLEGIEETARARFIAFDEADKRRGG